MYNIGSGSSSNNNNNNNNYNNHNNQHVGCRYSWICICVHCGLNGVGCIGARLDFSVVGMFLFYFIFRKGRRMWRGITVVMRFLHRESSVTCQVTRSLLTSLRSRSSILFSLFSAAFRLRERIEPLRYRYHYHYHHYPPRSSTPQHRDTRTRKPSSVDTNANWLIRYPLPYKRNRIVDENLRTYSQPHPRSYKKLRYNLEQKK